MERGKDMKRVIICHFVIVAIFVCFLGVSLSWATSPPKKGGTLPEISLSVPKDPLHRSYLGLLEGSQFKITQIKAQLLIIEIFNVY